LELEGRTEKGGTKLAVIFGVDGGLDVELEEENGEGRGMG